MRYLLILFLLAACSKPPDTFCWQCQYHDQQWIFCDYTQAQIDSLKTVFGYDCEDDLLNCKMIEP